jgi:hypothetical protein
MAGSVVLHSTLATRELPSSCSNPPSSANHRCSDAPATLHSSLSCPTLFTPPTLTHHSAAQTTSARRALARPTGARAATPHLPLVELQLPSVKAADHSTERRTATRVHLLVEQILPIPLRTFNTRQATTRQTAHVTVPPKHHVV